MTPMEFTLTILIAGFTGVIAQSLVAHNSNRVLASVAVGFVGALLGRWLAGKLSLPAIYGLHAGGHVFPVVWAIIGSVALVAAFVLLVRRGKPA